MRNPPITGTFPTQRASSAEKVSMPRGLHDTFLADFASYPEMNALNSQLKDSDDLVILAVPCNQFGYEEPGENYEIMDGIRYVRPGGNFIPHNYFYFFAKTYVNGPNEIPLYTFVKVRWPLIHNDTIL